MATISGNLARNGIVFYSSTLLPVNVTHQLFNQWSAHLDGCREKSAWPFMQTFLLSFSEPRALSWLTQNSWAGNVVAIRHETTTLVTPVFSASGTNQNTRKKPALCCDNWKSFSRMVKTTKYWVDLCEAVRLLVTGMPRAICIGSRIQRRLRYFRLREIANGFS